ncbi:MAG: transporter [Sneathiella sp.]|jgi:TRAP-type mannitol/chloroaromatic compound transport system permease small subunit|uniref:TRAP transporter small permease subunit n=1 Tax=Sneathiella sp. TaxID=1964365 RepID=UPI000C508055|nr:TRAP transporter small permease subunit [Sneathiella sp.]MAL77811.1 transporter [Sneathiella sp.]
MTLLGWAEKISEWANNVASLALLLMTLIVSFEVISRYFFNSPTIWAWDINVQLMVLLLMLGLSEASRKDLHVRVDVLVANLSARVKAFLDILFAPVFLFIAVMLVWSGWDYFSTSYSHLEKASTVFAPPLYPVKFFLPLGGALLILQGVLKLVRDIGILCAAGSNPDQGEAS